MSADERTRIAERLMRQGILHEVRPSQYAPEVYVQSAISVALAKQRFYWAGTGKLDLAVAGNVRAVLQNPAGSGRNIYVARVTGLATGTAWANVYLNPSVGVPTAAARPVNNAVLGAATSPVGIIRVDTDTTTALSGGVDTGVVLGIPANNRFSIDLAPFVVAPGVSLGFNDAFAGAASVAMSIYWWEE